jgi:hypothetical protein
MRIVRFRASLLACVLAFCLAPGVAIADEDSISNEAGIGALSALSSLIYGPVKIVYAATGLVVGGIAWGLSGGDSDVLTAVVTPAVRGDYVVTPAHVRFERSLEFFGQDPAYRVSRTAMLDDRPLIEDDYDDRPLIEDDY